MKCMHYTLAGLAIVCSVYVTMAQIKKNIFSAPLHIPLFLAGNFGEIRANHFHAGIDIKTQRVEGKVVVPAARGYISRIKISPYGYGKVLYINHPQGYTTVYAHLKEFYGPVAAYVKKLQYEKESWEVELFPDSSAFQVGPNDTIAFSGNTGGSLAPHLHFEIRDAGDQAPLNPLLFGFDIKDNVPPFITSVVLYPLTDSSSVNGKHSPFVLKVAGSEGHYKAVQHEPNKVQGTFGVGVEVFDRLNQMPNRCGVFSVSLFVDGNMLFEYEMNRIPFYETRYINSHIDYAKYKREKKEIQKCFVEKNNKLGIYKKLVHRGMITFSDDTLHFIKIVAKDAYMNKSMVTFTLQSEHAVVSGSNEDNKPYLLFKYDQKNHFQNKDIIIDIPEYLLYDDLKFTYHTSDTLPNALTPTHHIQDIYTPLHGYMQLAIRVGQISKALSSKAVAVALDEKNKVIASEGGKLQNGFIRFKTRTFGSYTVLIDSIPPRIRPVNIFNGCNMAQKKGIDIKITDNLSGIKYYRGTVDGKWILMEYDYKKNLLHYAFDRDRIGKGNHLFELLVKDERGNQSAYSASFIY